jgi:cbb3-type cytochrome oxidase subunit 3
MGSLDSGPVWGVTVVVLCLVLIAVQLWRFERHERQERNRRRNP